ncbi:MAG: tRNA (guanosine(37)-N1)-methyltransferase TrmD [Bacilli bacterium]
MKYQILTLFPKFFDGFKNHSIIKRALDQQIISLDVINYRDYTLNKHLKVDDTPYGGGAGMVLMVQPLVDALKAVKSNKSKVILLCPTGKPFKQADAFKLAQEQELIFICGHYEGYDERIRSYVDYEYSIGDFVLTGGELASMVMVDAISRLIPNVISKSSHEDDSFQNNLLEYPQYTKPQEYDGLKVPDVLLSGHHKEIEQYRLVESIKKTIKQRPDLIKTNTYTPEVNKIIEEQLKNYSTKE